MPRRPTAGLLLQSCLAALGLAAPAGCSRTPENAPARGQQAIVVSVATAERADAPLIVRTIGTVRSRSSVVLRPQVGGRVAQTAATEGTNVQAGEPLLLLDARPFEAALAVEEANLAKARALAADARALAARAREAQSSAALNPREVEQAEAQAQAADAEVQAARARVESARLDLSYCTVNAPFAGRLGQFLVKPGSIVRADETDLVELSQVDPIDVAFAVPEERLPQVRDGIAAGTLPVEVRSTGESGEPSTGELTFVDNQVDPTTGTIRLKATFSNDQRRLWPGQFVNVVLTLGIERDRIVVPDSAVEPSQQGAAVWVVGPDGAAGLRPVVVLRSVDGRSVLEGGVEAGETVVTEGQLRLSPGVKVETRAEAGR